MAEVAGARKCKLGFGFELGPLGKSLATLSLPGFLPSERGREERTHLLEKDPPGRAHLPGTAQAGEGPHATSDPSTWARQVVRALAEGVRMRGAELGLEPPTARW